MKVDVEHIFPRRWENANYDAMEEQYIKEYLEYIGNKILIEKKLNIQLKDGYFAQKKDL